MRNSGAEGAEDLKKGRDDCRTPNYIDGWKDPSRPWKEEIGNKGGVEFFKAFL